MANVGSMKIREEIILVLKEDFGGEVRDRDGFAVRKIFERCSRTGIYTTVSSEMSLMEKDGLIHRDMPSKKRTTRIALVEYSSHPPIKNVGTMVEQAGNEMAEILEYNINNLIDNTVEGRLSKEKERLKETVREEVEAEVSMLREENKELKSRLETGVAPHEARIDQLEKELSDVREALRIAEHNAEVWKQNALGRPKVQDMLTTIKERLGEQDRKNLEFIMQQIPEGER